MMLTLAMPEAVALVLPLGLAWWAWGRQGHGRWWRLAVLAVLVLAAMGPELEWERGGSDVIVLLDRSDSMRDARVEQQEIVTLVGAQRETGDRLGMVLFGEGAVVAQSPSAEGVARILERPIDGTASALQAGLEAASGLVAEGRVGRIVVHSDGETTGPSVRKIAAELASRRIVVDVLPVTRARRADAAIAQVELPPSLRVGESFIGAIRFVGDQSEVRAWRLLRQVFGPDGAATMVEVASGEVALNPGRAATVRFADRPPRAGVSHYEVRLDATDDAVADNNVARAALRVGGGEAVLVMGGDGRPGNLTAALQAAGMQVVTRPEGPIGLAELTGYRALVLEQVPADVLGIGSMTDIARWVEHLGGGLMMTGGRRAFGAGGFHKSPLEPVSPVTMEIRDEHRKFSMAMAVTLDRSGSMSATVQGGRTKMQLANAGTAAAIELLGPGDRVAVHAVDSAPHVVLAMTDVDDKGRILALVRGIRSQGGGIYVYEALRAAGQELLKSNRATRHLVLFADAADAVEEGDYINLLKDFTAVGITVSVIGLGRDTDPDAELLRDIAARGNGRAWFAQRAEDLPRVFAQETLLVARSAFVDDPATLQVQPGLSTVVGPNAAFDAAWPSVAGYNLTYARPRAQVLAMAAGDPAAPAAAAWRIGTGRAVALPFDLDAPGSGFSAWAGYAPLVSGLARWASGADDTLPGVLTAVRHGRTATVRLELDPERRDAWPARAPDLTQLYAGQLVDARQTPMRPVDVGVFEAEVPVTTEAMLTAVAIGPHDGAVAVNGPAMELLYSPEADPRYGQKPGRALLAEVAKTTRGAELGDVSGVYDNPSSEGRRSSVSPLLLALALLLLVLEVAIRRMHLRWPKRRRAAATATATTRAPAGDTVARPTASFRGRKAAASPAVKPPATEAAPEDRQAGAARAAKPDETGLSDALAALKRRR